MTGRPLLFNIGWNCPPYYKEKKRMNETYDLEKYKEECKEYEATGKPPVVGEKELLANCSLLKNNNRY